jgi:hypothetical protein
MIEILNIQTFTNYYMFGTFNTPSVLTTDDLIRPEGLPEATATADVDAFMTTGAGICS